MRHYQPTRKSCFPCGRERNATSRRQWLAESACGFGSLGLLALLSNQTTASSGRIGLLSALHHEPRAKRVIFLYMDGGPSQIDTFDPKPMLAKYDGKPFPMKSEPTQFDNKGNTLMSPWNFSQYGDSGLWISSLFPNISRHADRLAVVRSMTSEFSEHTSANYFLHTGAGMAGRPSMGAWLSYGLGSESNNLPDFVVINGGLTPPGGLENFSSGFLPSAHQASLFTPTARPIANLAPPTSLSSERLQAKRSLLTQLDAQFSEATGGAEVVSSAIDNFELAYSMQSSVPDAADFSKETNTALELYGVNNARKTTAIFARECLMARRLIERGVRMIELTCPSVGHDRWDQHNNLRKGHEDNALAVDQPIAGLLTDLSDRGLLDETLVVWAGEFGRTPFAQGANGRDHNPYAASIWFAGGGIRGGMTYGETDEFGYKTIEGKTEIYDLHATMLHLLGIDHERLTFRFGGRDHRLTDVHGRVITEILA